MFCALLMSRYQVSVYRTNGPLVLHLYCPRIFWLNTWDLIYLLLPRGHKHGSVMRKLCHGLIYQLVASPQCGALQNTAVQKVKVKVSAGSGDISKVH